MKNEPLMFIQTVSTDIKTSVHQVIFDSKRDVSRVNPKILKKSENLVLMYQKGKPVLCSVNLKDKSVVGFPSEVENSVLHIMVDEVVNTVRLDEISSITILKL
ncbi:hypothetical protein RJG79_06485 [Mycoplasmatota bacterium WC44]